MHAGSISVEFNIFIEHYSKLVDIMEAKSILKYFIEEKVILPREAESITMTTSSKRAAELLLMKISAPLQAGFKDCSANFNKLLNIIKQHGNIAAIELCIDIEKKLSKMRTGDQVSDNR